MPFNRWSYYANKYEREAREYLALARAIKRGEHPNARPGAVQSLVALARDAWRSARVHRACNRACK
jgi:hypothetical protein